MDFTTLIDTPTLAGLLGNRPLAIVDCRFALDDPSWGARSFAASHVPGAVFADLDRDLSGPKTGLNGRHPLPDPQGLAETLSQLGIGDDTQVVAYDQDAGMYASRLWWLLKWLGHEAVAVLDGGFAKWLREGRDVSSASATPPRASLSVRLRPGMVSDVKEVLRVLQDPTWRLIDARAPERYRGDLEPIDRVPGHIPTAVNHFFRLNVDESGVFLPVETLARNLADVTSGVPPDRVVCYCGSGVTACQEILAREHAGLAGATLYPGSWSEWASDESRPIVRGSGAAKK